MGDRNLGSESLYGQNENFENFKTAVNWTPRVELSSSLGNINLYYKSHFLRRFLEIRLSVFFGKKSEIFKTHYENFERGLEVRRGDKASEKERKKKSRRKTLLFFFFFFFFFCKKWTYFFAAFEVPWGLQQCWAPFRATRLDVASVKMAPKCQKMPKRGYIVMDTDCGDRKGKSADF